MGFGLATLVLRSRIQAGRLEVGSFHDPSMMLQKAP